MRYSFPSLFRMNPDASTFLDLGCGQGFISLYAAARGLQVKAIDIETEIPSPLQDIANVEYIVADLKEWKPAGKYDIIVAHHSIQFLPKEYSLQEFIPHLCTSLNSGGLLEIFTFTPEETLTVPTKYTLEEVVGALTAHGLEIVQQETLSYDGMHRKVGAHTFHELHVIVRKLV